MDHRLRWRQLSIGIFAACAIVAGALFILLLGRTGSLRGKKFRLYVAANAARGLIRGSEVWLDGQKVGIVRAISFRPPTAAPSERLVLALDVLEEDRSRVRLDTRVQVRAGATIIGDRVVYLNSGTARMRAVVDGDTLRASDQSDFEQLSSDAALASREFPGIIENLKILAVGLKTAEGTLGALGLDNHGSELRRVEARTERLWSGVFDSHGSLSLAMGERSNFAARAREAMARVDSIRSLVTSNQHSLGRFRRDSTILGDIASARAELAELARLSREPNGMIGRVRGDSAIGRALRRSLVSVDSLRVDMKRRPLRYWPF